MTASCDAPGCTNPLPAPGPGRPARARSPAASAHGGHAGASSKGRPPGQIWLVQLRRGGEALIVAIGLHRSAADALADDINAFL